MLGRLAFAGFAALALYACSPGAGAPKHPENMKTAVSELIESWAAAGENKDWDALADLYADQSGFAWIERGAVQYKDHAEILAGIEAAKAMDAKVSNKISNIVVTPLSSDAAAYYADYALSVASDSFSFSSEGVLSGVAVKSGEKWRFLQGAFSEKPRQEAGPSQ